MLGRAIWDKLPNCIFEKFEIAGVKRGWLIYPKTCLKQTCESHQTNKHFVLKLIPYLRGQLQISEQAIQNRRQLQNNAVNGAMSVSINRGIYDQILQQIQKTRLLAHF